MEKYKFDLWNDNFKLNKKEFKRHNYAFNYMIKTDGVACSILLIKLQDGKPIYITPKLQKEAKKKLENLDKYIENIEITNRMKKKRIVTVDPGLSDIVHAVSKNIKEKVIFDENDKLKVIEGEEIIKFRYTQNQRRLETRNKKYNKIQETVNKTIIIDNSTDNDAEIINLINSVELKEIEIKLLNFSNFVTEKIKQKFVNLRN